MNSGNKESRLWRLPVSVTTAVASTLGILAITAWMIQEGTLKEESIVPMLLAGSASGGTASAFITAKEKAVMRIAAGIIPALILVTLGCALSGKEGIGALTVLCSACLFLPAALLLLRRKRAYAKRMRYRRRSH